MVHRLKPCVFSDRSGDERTQPEKKQGADKDIGREKERTRIEGLIRQRRLLERDDISGFGHFVDSCGLKRGHGCYKLFLGELGFDGEILILAYHSVEIALLRAEARNRCFSCQVGSPQLSTAFAALLSPERWNA